jgi:hypothetical protein
MKTVFTSCVLLLARSAISQIPPCITPTQRAAIITTDWASSDTLWFGFHPLGSCGVDTLLCGEATEWPPPPPTGVFDARWIPTSAACSPSPRFDYRGYVSPAGIDTHRILLQENPSSEFPLLLRWNKDSVAQICDSALLQDDFGGLFVRKRMDRDSTATISTLFTNHLTLIRYGQRLTTVSQEGQDLPGPLFLYPNFPNPFNPRTVIRFQNAKSVRVTLAIFDLLGRKIATLADGPMSPGIHETAFDANGIPSGVYLCRLSAGPYTQISKMLVLK